MIYDNIQLHSLTPEWNANFTILKKRNGNTIIFKCKKTFMVNTMRYENVKENLRVNQNGQFRDTGSIRHEI